MVKIFVGAGGLLGALGVAAGAIGAHVLRGRLGAETLAMYDKATLYLLLHAVALLVTGALLKTAPTAVLLRAAGWLYLIGIIFFCGSLFVLALTGYVGVPMLAPTGGLALIFAWLVLFVSTLKEL